MTAKIQEITIFDKILSGEKPCAKVYEDEYVLAFRDLKPQAQTHIQIIPKHKEGLTSLKAAEEKHVDILGRLLLTVSLVAK